MAVFQLNSEEWGQQKEKTPLKRLRVLLADDHIALLERVVGFLKPEYDIVASVNDGNALVEAALSLRPDLVIADISMPGLNGIEAVRQLKSAGSTATVIFLTIHEDPDFVPECFEAGGSAYVVKSRLASDLIPAIRMVLTNHTYVSPTVPWNRFR
jgi:DNA-binding NarL/FixJ family response regulator